MTAPAPVRPRSGAGLRMGRVIGVPVYVRPSWFLVAAFITIAFAPIVQQRFLPDFGAGVYLVTLAFAVLLYVSVFLHELSHAVAARAFGLPVRAITLHVLGGVTEIERDAPTPGRDVVVSAAGPVVSLVLGGLATLVVPLVEQPVLWFLLLEVAVANLAVGAFNLLPALPLDGGHVLRALVWRVSGSEYRGTVVAARAGQVLAVAVVPIPFVLAGGVPDLLPLVWVAVLAAVLWSGAAQALTVGRLRARLPSLRVDTLARPAVGLPGGATLAEARDAMVAAGARAVLVTDEHARPVAVLNLAAAAAVPVERTGQVDVGATSRALEVGLVLPGSLTGEDLLAHLRTHPASEYLVEGADGGPLRVLVTADVDAALAPRSGR